MNEHIFLVTKEAHSRAAGRRLDKIARKHGATYVGPVQIPGSSITGWFTCENRGEPFNGMTARAVMVEINAGGAR